MNACVCHFLRSLGVYTLNGKKSKQLVKLYQYSKVARIYSNSISEDMALTICIVIIIVHSYGGSVVVEYC